MNEQKKGTLRLSHLPVDTLRSDRVFGHSQRSGQFALRDGANAATQRGGATRRSIRTRVLGLMLRCIRQKDIR